MCFGDTGTAGCSQDISHERGGSADRLKNFPAHGITYYTIKHPEGRDARSNQHFFHCRTTRKHVSIPAAKDMILVVDDEPLISDIIAKCLEAEGYDCEISHSA
jgi:hypothetical protein